MSATNRNPDVRRPDDDYGTPEWCVRALFEPRGFLAAAGDRWVEPAAGNGSIIRSVNAIRGSAGLPLPSWEAVEKQEMYRARLLESGVPTHIMTVDEWCRDIWFPEASRRSVFITNPPFKLAEQYFIIGMKVAEVVVLLLRLNWLASAKRAEMLRRWPPDIYVLPNRPSFTGDGRTDATDYAWYVWYPLRERRFGEVRVLPPMPKEARGRVVQRSRKPRRSSGKTREEVSPSAV